MDIYFELLKHPVFSIEDVCTYIENARTARVSLEKMMGSGKVLKIRNGLYTCVSGENGGPVADRFQIASAITSTSYVSHHSAFEYYGVSDQVFNEVYVSSQTRFQDFYFDGYNYHFIRAKITDGVYTPEYSGGIKITDKEQTMLDSIKDMNRIAGLEEVISCMTSFKLLDEEKILKYLRKYDSIFLCQKVGFLTELFQEELGISTDFLNACEDMIGNSKRYLTEDAIEVAYSRRWKLVYPEKIKYIKNGEFLDADI